MARTSIPLLLFAGLAVVGQVSPANAQVRLEGLERLYFNRIAGPGQPLPKSLTVALLLPETLPRPGFALKPPDEMGASENLRVHDFELPSRSSKHRLWIREIEDHGGRIADLWWALYDGGRRSDVWGFDARSNRAGNKVLSNYTMDGFSMPAKDVVIFRVQGEMFRPQGAWWVVGKEWTFVVGDSALTFDHVLSTFGFSQGYDTGETEGSLSVSTERKTEGRFETRTLDPVSMKTKKACGFRDPLGNDDWEFSWSRLTKVAQCITSRPDAEIALRKLDEPSFIERGGSSSEP